MTDATGGPALGGTDGAAGPGHDRTASVAPGAYDAAAVAAAARAADPGLTPGQALSLARAAGRLLVASPGADAPEVARALLADDPDGGATPATVVARAAVDAWSLSAVEPA